MTRLGLIGRADNGGLGQQTVEFARHMHPDAVVIVNMPNNRGGYHPQRYDHVPERLECGPIPVGTDPMPEDALGWLIERSDVIFTCESPYNQKLYYAAHEAGRRVVVQANPELLDPLTFYADEIWLPTSWLYDESAARVHAENPNCVVRQIPVPVATDRCKPSCDDYDGPLRILHIGAPAMDDRNGSEAALAAAETMTASARWTVYPNGSQAPWNAATSPIRVDLHGPVENYWELYNDQDVLVLPRRYGGLSLPAQEAAACGLAVVMTDLEPQRGWCGVMPVVGAAEGGPRRMKGGYLPVYEPDVASLVAILDSLASNPAGTRKWGQRAGWRWAQELSWEHWQPTYEELLRG